MEKVEADSAARNLVRNRFQGDPFPLERERERERERGVGVERLMGSQVCMEYQHSAVKTILF